MGKHIEDQPVQAPPTAPPSLRHPLFNHFSPTIIPELQNRDVISVVVGDYHYGALTASGELLTWGAFSWGALGLGDPTTAPPGAPGGFATQADRDSATHHQWGLGRVPPEVRVPSTVRFDHGERRARPKFCFAAAACGWHTGALAIDLDVRTLFYVRASVRPRLTRRYSPMRTKTRNRQSVRPACPSLLHRSHLPTRHTLLSRTRRRFLVWALSWAVWGDRHISASASPEEGCAVEVLRGLRCPTLNGEISYLYRCRYMYE